MIEMRVVTLKPWQVWLAGAFALAVVLAILFLAASLAIVLVPVVLIAGAVMALLAKLGFVKRATPAEEIISVDYRVVDEPTSRLPPRDQAGR